MENENTVSLEAGAAHPQAPSSESIPSPGKTCRCGQPLEGKFRKCADCRAQNLRHQRAHRRRQEDHPEWLRPEWRKANGLSPFCVVHPQLQRGFWRSCNWCQQDVAFDAEVQHDRQKQTGQIETVEQIIEKKFVASERYRADLKAKEEADLDQAAVSLQQFLHSRGISADQVHERIEVLIAKGLAFHQICETIKKEVEAGG